MQNWLKTIRQFSTLILGIALFLGLSHSCARWFGYSQQFTRIDHPVLNKINNIIHLGLNNALFVVKNKGESKLPEAIKNMGFAVYSLTSESKPNWLPTALDEECVFLKFEPLDQTQQELDEVIKIFDSKTCVFVFTPHLKIKSYFSFKKPRWFYNILEVDLQKSRFLASLGLETLASLKGDFIVLGQNELNHSDPLFKELLRRDLIIFEMQNN